MKRRFEPVQQPIGQLNGLLLPLDFLHKNDEFIPAEPEQHSFISNDLGETGAGFYQQTVTEFMAKRVIYVFKVVRIYEEQSRFPVGTGEDQFQFLQQI
ncbi:hypothetical protein D3C76_1454750 [compost metagenome]